MRVAIHSVKKKGAKKIIIAVPVAPPETVQEVESDVDAVICLYKPVSFEAVGQFYEKFDQTGDEEVIALLK